MATVLTEVSLPGSDTGIDWVNPFIQLYGELSSELPGMGTAMPMLGAAVLVGMIGYMLFSRFLPKMKKLGGGGFFSGTIIAALVGFPLQAGVVLIGLFQTALNVAFMVVIALVNAFTGA